MFRRQARDGAAALVKAARMATGGLTTWLQLISVGQSCIQASLGQLLCEGRTIMSTPSIIVATIARTAAFQQSSGSASIPAQTSRCCSTKLSSRAKCCSVAPMLQAITQTILRRRYC